MSYLCWLSPLGEASPPGVRAAADVEEDSPVAGRAGCPAGQGRTAA